MAVALIVTAEPAATNAPAVGEVTETVGALVSTAETTLSVTVGESKVTVPPEPLPVTRAINGYDALATPLASNATL